MLCVSLVKHKSLVSNSYKILIFFCCKNLSVISSINCPKNCKSNSCQNKIIERKNIWRRRVLPSHWPILHAILSSHSPSRHRNNVIIQTISCTRIYSSLLTDLGMQRKNWLDHDIADASTCNIGPSVLSQQ